MTQIPDMFLKLAAGSRRSQIYCNGYQEGFWLLVVDECQIRLCPLRHNVEDVLEELRSLCKDNHLRIVK